MENIIEIKGLKKQYKNANYFSLKGIDLEIPKQSVFGLLGPNGAGKTTLISILSGLIKPTSGLFTLQGTDATTFNQDIKQTIGIVPQEYALYPSLTAYENLMYFGSLYNISKHDLKQRILNHLTDLGLEDFIHNKVQTFSGGMKRRVNLIAGILHQPQVLFLDEPTVGVDVQSRAKIIDFLKELNAQGTTIIYTSHHLKEAENFCTRIAIIEQGKIYCEDSPQNLIKNMETATFIYMLIEAIILLVPLATLFIKVGGYKKMLDDIDKRTKDYTEWKAKTETKVTQLELQTIAQQNTLESINKSLIEISTKVGLLLEDKIKLEK